MDNVTHSLIGFTLGQLFPVQKEKVQNLRRAAIWTAVLGSNLPDLDFLLTPLGIAGNLGYLMQHRGYTHTVILSVPLGIISAWLGLRLAGVKRPVQRGKFEWTLFGLGVLAVLLHVAADFCNNYGVHPFSPLLNRWFYGGVLFIIEPSLWLSLLPLVFFTSSNKWVRGIVFGLELLLFGLIWGLPMIPFSISCALTLWALGFILLQMKLQSAKLGLSSIGLVLLIFGAGSATARDLLRRAVLEPGNGLNSDAVQLLQLSTNPMPGNPFCWTSVVSTSENQKDYVARAAVISLLPALFSPESCSLERGISGKSRMPGAPETPRTRKTQMFPMGPVTASLLSFSPSIDWNGEFRKPWSEVKELIQESCRFEAFLRFSRFPVWNTQSSPWIAGDLRYNQNSGGGFSRIEIDPQLQCPKNLPPWEFPAFKIPI